MSAYALVPDRFPVLRGNGLTLRELIEADLPAWLGRLSDPEAAALAGDPVSTAMQTVIDGLAHHRNAFRNKEALRWSIVPDVVGESVGTMGSVVSIAFTAARRSAGRSVVSTGDSVSRRLPCA